MCAQGSVKSIAYDMTCTNKFKNSQFRNKLINSNDKCSAIYTAIDIVNFLNEEALIERE